MDRAKQVTPADVTSLALDRSDPVAGALCPALGTVGLLDVWVGMVCVEGVASLARGRFDLVAGALRSVGCCMGCASLAGGALLMGVW